MHVDTIRRRHGERVYESQLVRRSVRDGTFRRPRKAAARPAPGPGGIREALAEARRRFVDNL